MTGTAQSIVGALAITCLGVSASGWQGEATNGMREADLRTHAIVDATVVVSPGQVLEHATIVIDDGVIQAVGSDVAPPAGARIWSGEGLMVYPGLIDPAVLVDTDDLDPAPGRHWNKNVRSERRMSEEPELAASRRKQLRAIGMTVVAIYPKQGIIRGSGTVTTLGDDSDHLRLYGEQAAQFVAMESRGGWQSDPGSLMGAIALIRQTLDDAEWYAKCQRVYEDHPEGNEAPAPNEAFAALADVVSGYQPALFEVTNELNALRAARIAREFDLDLVLLGAGTEFRRLDEVLEINAPIILPLDFPKRPDVTSLAKADSTTLRTLQTWEQAPTNPRRLIAGGATVAFTTHRLKNPKDIFEKLRTTVQHGLSEEDALAAITTTPAALLGLGHVVGTIEPGKAANLVVVDGSLFDKKMKIRDTWINGRRHEINAAPDATLAFTGELVTDSGQTLAIKVDTKKPSASFPLEDKPAKAKKVSVMKDRIAITVDGRPFGVDGYVQLRGVISRGAIAGTGSLPDGERFAFTITPDPDAPEDPDEDVDDGKEAVAVEGDDDENDDDENDDDTELAAGPGGEWTLSMEMGERSRSMGLTIEVADDGSTTATMSSRRGDVTFDDVTFDAETGAITLSSDDVEIEGVIEGDDMTAEMRRGEMVIAMTGGRASGVAATGDSDDDKKEEFEMPPDAVAVPFGAYGRFEAPAVTDVLVTNATIWTCGADGIIENGSMLVRDGEIMAVVRGSMPVPDGVTVIDAEGRHVTPGLLDCHSHTGIAAGVNEGGQTNTAEVRIADVIDPDDVNFYRQLAGGLTAANQLHGSANPIGGQNSVIKLKWGGRLDEQPVEGAIGGIKFALGENVKRSTQRYPNTRMGVETFIRDAFTAAVAYRDAQERYRELPTRQRRRSMPPRRDLELETLVEILDGERIVHCHSYRQDEILMLVRVADEFGFTIGTFQHVLEGYKVAEAIAAHGAGASSFSDWWAYKVEVMDAIPYNGALMTNVGVLVSFNSDSSEVARRMNTEASKAVRYGGLDPQEALKLVTLNPAKQLRIDDRVGSLEVGKDADFVIWSEDPLSTYARCEQTWIEGACYFDLQRDREARAEIQAERQRLIQKILAQSHGDPPLIVSSEPSETPTVSAEWRVWAEEQVRLGHDPELLAPGDCGCGHLGQHGHGGVK